MVDVQLPQWTLTIASDRSYHDMQELVNETIIQQIGDLKIKKPTKSLSEMVTMLDSSSKDLEYRISDRKDLLKQYIQQKYADGAPIYLSQLEKMEIIK